MDLALGEREDVDRRRLSDLRITRPGQNALLNASGTMGNRTPGIRESWSLLVCGNNYSYRDF